MLLTGFESGLFVAAAVCLWVFNFLLASAGVVAKLNPATATINDDEIKAIVLVLKLLMFSLSFLVISRGNSTIKMTVLSEYTLSTFLL